MDRMLVIVFDSEPKAYEGKKALQELSGEGSIGLYAYTVLAKQPDGTATIRQGDNMGPIGTVLGTSFGALIGALGGPAGMAIGATAGMSAGAGLDFGNLGLGEDFIDDVSKAMRPGKVAVIAEVDEDWVTPVDSRMEAIGGTVYRRALSDVKNQVREENVAAMKADLAQMKAEQAQVKADQKATLDQKISELDSKIQAQLQRNKDRMAGIETQARLKADVLKAKAAAARARAS